MSSSIQSSELALPADLQEPTKNVLVLGAYGDLGGSKLMHWYQQCLCRGIEIYAADIVKEKKFESAAKFSGFKEYFNLEEPNRVEDLDALGRLQPFDIIYDATWPESRLVNFLRWYRITGLYLGTKPFTAVNQAGTLKALIEPSAHKIIVAKLRKHDHYTFKPGFEEIAVNLPAIHRKYGTISRMTIMITERKTITEERHRLRALKGGMIPDLASHAVMMLQRLLPEGLAWQDEQGYFIKRLSRSITPTTCVRARMTNAACDNDVDTACIIEYHVLETLYLLRGNKHSRPSGEPFHNSFYVLVLCGKGLRLSRDTERDLKSVEIAFQGQGESTGIIDLETNTLNEVFLEVPGVHQPNGQLQRHKGINLPLIRLLDKWPMSLQQSESGPGRNTFQPPNLIGENMDILSATVAVARGGIWPSYSPFADPIHHFVNEHIGPTNGFQYFGAEEGSSWPRRDEPRQLLRGSVPDEKELIH